MGRQGGAVYGGEHQRPDGATTRRSGPELPTLFVERTITCSFKGQLAPWRPRGVPASYWKGLAEAAWAGEARPTIEYELRTVPVRPESAVVRQLPTTRMVDRAIFGTVTYEWDRAYELLPTGAGAIVPHGEKVRKMPQPRA